MLSYNSQNFHENLEFIHRAPFRLKTPDAPPVPLIREIYRKLANGVEAHFRGDEENRRIHLKEAQPRANDYADYIEFVWERRGAPENSPIKFEQALTKGYFDEVYDYLRARRDSLTKPRFEKLRRNIILYFYGDASDLGAISNYDRRAAQRCFPLYKDEGRGYPQSVETAKFFYFLVGNARSVHKAGTLSRKIATEYVNIVRDYFRYIWGRSAYKLVNLPEDKQVAAFHQLLRQNQEKHLDGFCRELRASQGRAADQLPYSSLNKWYFPWAAANNLSDLREDIRPVHFRGAWPKVENIHIEIPLYEHFCCYLSAAVLSPSATDRHLSQNTAVHYRSNVRRFIEFAWTEYCAKDKSRSSHGFQAIWKQFNGYIEDNFGALQKKYLLRLTGRSKLVAGAALLKFSQIIGLPTRNCSFYLSEEKDKIMLAKKSLGRNNAHKIKRRPVRMRSERPRATTKPPPIDKNEALIREAEKTLLKSLRSQGLNEEQISLIDRRDVSEQRSAILVRYDKSGNRAEKPLLIKLSAEDQSALQTYIVGITSDNSRRFYWTSVNIEKPFFNLMD